MKAQERDARLPAPYPLYWPEDWPRTRAWDRKSSKYKVEFLTAREEVAKSLRLMTGDRGFSLRQFSVSTDVPLRLDGLPLAGQREPHDPGVAVWWLAKGNLRVMACDQWRTVRENLRAVGLALEALRAFERCGATQILDRAMQSFERPALQEGRPWWFHELVLAYWPPQSASAVDAAFKAQAAKKHPDVGGTHEGFLTLQRARNEALGWLANR